MMRAVERRHCDDVPSRDQQTVTVAGHRIRVSNLDKVLYPATGTTKGEVIAYYRAVASVLLPGLTGRVVTRKRWPNGTDREAFFTKNLDSGTPSWVRRVLVSHSGDRGSTGETARYPLIESEADLVWMAQMAALELHVPQWRLDPDQLSHGRATHRSEWLADRVVIDLDPGPGVGLAECVQVAQQIRRRLDGLGDAMVPVTSGSKGLHLYVPLSDPIDSAAAADWARQIATTVMRDLPQLVTATMTKTLRMGKVFVDWSQNNGAKTTIAPYSLRGRERPTVAAPRTWAELDDPDLAHLTMPQVLDRITAGLNPTAGLDPPAAAVPDLTSPRRENRPSIAVTGQTVRLSLGLAGPVAVALAKAEDTIPAARALPGGCVYELKWDGYRAAVVIGDDGTARVWSRQGVDLSEKFPDIAGPAGRRLPPGTVIDGEVVIYNGSRLDFDLLQRRLANSTAKIPALVRAHPASYMAFDLLAEGGQDLRDRPLIERRRLLEELTNWVPPLQLSPTTTDRDQAQQWMADYRPAGVEGIVAKGSDSSYQPGVRAWVKTKSRATQEVIVGGVIGPIDRPEVLIAGLRRANGDLVNVGRTVPLKPAQSKKVAAAVRPAQPGHPWPDMIGNSRFGGGRDKVPLTKVEPTVIAEVSADTGLQAGAWRHPLRFVRLRADLRPKDLPTLDDPAPTA